uniref:T. congolense-specific, cell surface-expressed gene family n=1 Tax=Trypanosoma congolense (strain IL3000) TaxID=1068625 RepID=G0UN73_TRYCI|nr:hypothetical protein, unlikely [Trypanosoma congolense IL3000]
MPFFFAYHLFSLFSNCALCYLKAGQHGVCWWLWVAATKVITHLHQRGSFISCYTRDERRGGRRRKHRERKFVCPLISFVGRNNIGDQAGARVRERRSDPLRIGERKIHFWHVLISTLLRVEEEGENTVIRSNNRGGRGKT